MLIVMICGMMIIIAIGDTLQDVLTKEMKVASEFEYKGKIGKRSKSMKMEQQASI